MSGILSFHPLIETGWNRVLSGGLPESADLRAMEKANAVVLPQGCREELYLAAGKHCRHVFPNYGARFRYPGKTGQARLFAELGTPCPKQLVLKKESEYSAQTLPFSYPFVIKGAWGGEGNNVVLINDQEKFEANRSRVCGWLRNGGCLVQEYVPAGGESLRVVVIGNSFYPYWRINPKGGFYSNLARGAVVCRKDSFKELEDRAIDELRFFCRATGIDLAGFDFLFSSKESAPRPLFLEINYCFRTHGLGGPDSYLKLLEKGVREWLAGLFEGPVT